MHNKKAFTLVEIMIVVTIFILLAAMVIPACDHIVHKDERRHAQYDSWKAIYHREDITYEQWCSAVDAGVIVVGTHP